MSHEWLRKFNCLEKRGPVPLSGDAAEFAATLPEDYRRFLETFNGGAPDRDEVWFDTPVPWNDRPSSEDGVREFYSLEPGAGGCADLRAKQEELGEEAFLPSWLLPIADCESSSIVAISLREDDSGAVYYWDWYWRYPWRRDFYEHRLDEVRDRYTDIDAILDDPHHTRFQEALDAANAATVVRVAASFADFARLLGPPVE